MLSESDLAAQVAAFLEQEQGWTCYQEVSLDRTIREEHPRIGDARADLVCTRETHHGTQVAVVECKLDLSWELLAQARRWREYAHFIAVAASESKDSPGRELARQVTYEQFGYGVLEVGDRGVQAFGQPSPHRCPLRVDALLLSLKEGQRSGYAKAGSPGGKHFTDFRQTAQALAAYVAENPNCKLSEALESIGHHYRTKAEAESRLRTAIRNGLVPGVFVGWKQRLWATESEARTGGVG